MKFFEAVKAMDDGKVVKMTNATNLFKLADDGSTFVSRPVDGGGWRAAVFFSCHIRGEWMIEEVSE